MKRDLDRIVAALLPLRPAQILLHGSMARGDWNRASDIDLIVVMETEARLVDRVRAVLRLLDTEISVEPMVYTPAEFQLGLAQGHPFLTQALKEGRWIYHAG